MAAERPGKQKKRISEMTLEEFTNEMVSELIDIREAFTNLGPVAFFTMRREHYLSRAKALRDQGDNSAARLYEDWAEECREDVERYKEMHLPEPPRTPETN